MRALLVDADGVMQRNPDGWLDEVTKGVPEGDRRRFADDLFATEEAAMVGRRDFAGVLDEVCTRWGVADQAERLRRLWRRVEVSEEMVALVREVRATGTPCHLVTNQNEDRAAFLRSGLGYEDLFDRLFVSCELGRTKSEEGFFRHVAELLDLPPGELLLVDDSEHHVESARAVGMRAEQWSLDEDVARLRDLLSGHGVPLPPR